MKKVELMKIFYVIKASYPRFYKDYTALEIEQLLSVWGLVLADYSYEQVSNGVRHYLATDVKGFPPSPGQIVDSICKISVNQGQELSADEAWSCVVRAVSNSTYHSAEEFERLPEICKKIVSSPRQLMDWVEDDSFNSVARSNFLKSFREKVEKQKEENKIPNSVLLAQKNLKLIKE